MTVAWIAEVLDRKARSEELSQGDGEEAPLWRPTIKNLDDLIQAVSEKHDTREVSGCRLEAHLASLASMTDPERYMEYILDCVRQHALSYNAYDNALQRWIADRAHSTRPNNPPHEIWFVQALRRCGINVIPKLLALASEPGALHVVPEALVAIVSDPWEKQNKKRFSLMITMSMIITTVARPS